MPPHGRNINYVVRRRADGAGLRRRPQRQPGRARAQVLGEAQARIAELAIEIPLYGVTKLDAVPARLKGFTGNPTNTGPFWNVHAWTLD